MKRKTIKLPEIIINGHGHARDMNQTHKFTVEQYLKESREAKIGISILMPNTDPPITSIAVLERYIWRIERARKKLGIQEKQYVYFGITDDNLKECERALRHPLVIGLKDYPRAKDGKTVTTGTIGVAHRLTREVGIRLAATYNKVYARHCDNPKVIAKEGNTINAEVADIRDTIKLAKLCPRTKILICHVSCREGAELILEAQEEGLRIAIEICPQYLWFDSNMTNWIPEIDPVFYHCYNNLRPRENRNYLQKDLITKENPLVFISSDSAPHLETEKMANKKLGGIPSHQELVPLAITLVKQKVISEKQMANLISFNPSKFFNIPVPEELVEYEIEEKVDNLQYNHGKVLNPWNGSKLWFPKRKE